MQYLVLCDAVAPDSFLRMQLRLEAISGLRIGPVRYIDMFLDKMQCFKDFKIITVHTPLQNVAALANAIAAADPIAVNLHQELSVFYYDLNFFPVNFAECSSLFAKLALIDKGAAFFTVEGNKRLAIAIQKHHLQRGNIQQLAAADSGAEPIDVDVTGKFLDMHDTRTVIDLFANNFQTRYFNKLTNDGMFIRKTSEDKRKMTAEYGFYQNLPASIKPFFPHTGEMLHDGGLHGYQIERMYMLDASKLLLNGALTPDAVEGLLGQLLVYFEHCPRKNVGVQAYRAVLRELFLTKPEQRFAMLQELPVAARLNTICEWNGYGGIAGYKRELAAALEEVIASGTNTELCFSHGDLCLSNILFDTRTRQIKLIDPRGYAGEQDTAFFPLYYDLAKLSHSLIGKYDYIVSGMATVQLTGRLAFASAIPADATAGFIQPFQRFLATLGVSLREVRLFEASLFLSMLPLHKDSAGRMAAQLLQSLEAFAYYNNKEM